MDISLQNLSLKKEGYRWLVVWLDTGGSLIIKKRDSSLPGGVMQLVRQSTSVSFAATDGPAPAHQIPVLRKAREGVS